MLTAIKGYAVALLLGLLVAGPAVGAESAKSVPISEETAECLDCHADMHRGIVADWRNSAHAKTAYVKKEGQPQPTSVGCAECHTLGGDKKAGSFEHNGYQVHTVVSPADCAVCHGKEADQFSRNLMAHAYGNLMNNRLYLDMASAMTGRVSVNPDGAMSIASTKEADLTDSCLHCHGTKIQVGELITRESELGEMEIPELAGWPNQGVGRINPDGSMGACTACHPRHDFSRADARKPETCSQCHKGPDVPAYGVYKVSKHGNIYSNRKNDWDFKAKEWVPGKHFQTPTCAACHISRLVSSNGEVIAERTHAMSDRLADRIFGPIYVVPHPKSPDLSIMRTAKGLPLPVDLDGTLAKGYLIDQAEAKTRRGRMSKVCLSCHAGQWVSGHFAGLDRVIARTNGKIKEATKLLQAARDKGLVDPKNMFDEYIERLWSESWLFYANSIRFSAAMAGADYAVFDKGYWYLMRTMNRMSDLVKAGPGQGKAAK